MKTPFHSAAPYGGLPDAVPGVCSSPIPIDSEFSFDNVPIYWDCMNLGGVYSNQHANLTEHVLKRGLEPYVRFVLLQWKDMNL